MRAGEQLALLALHVLSRRLHGCTHGLPVVQGACVAAAARRRVLERQCPRPSDGFGDGIVRDAVHQADQERRIELQATPAEHEVQGSLGADEARRTLRAARAGHKPEQHLGQRELGTRPGHSEVRCQRDLQPAAKCRTLHRRDHGLVQRFDRVADLGQQRRLPRPPELADVGAAEKHLARPGEHHRPDRLVLARARDGVQQSLAHGVTERVDRRVVDGDDQDLARSLAVDGFSHGS